MENINNSIAYTISVDGIEDMLRQFGQLERSMNDVSGSFDQLAKQSNTFAAQSLAAAVQMKTGFTRNMQDIRDSIIGAAGAYNSFRVVLGNMNTALMAQRMNIQDLVNANDTAQESFVSIGEVVQGQIGNLDRALKGLQPIDESLISNKASEETQQTAGRISTSVKQLQNQLQQLSASDNKDDKQENNSLLSAIGLDKAGETLFRQKLSDVQQVVSESAQTIGSIFEVQKNERLNQLQEEENRQIQQVQNSTLSEQDKAKKIAQIQKESADKANQVEVAAKKQQQKLDIVTSIINTALAVGKALAAAPPPFNAILAAIAAAQGAAQTVVIATQKFARGGVLPFDEGGMIQGPSHSMGGVPFLAGGSLMEAEGGEVIVNRNIWSRPDFVRSISHMNALTGGKRFFAAGGVLPSPVLPGVYTGSSQVSQPFDTEFFLKGLRGVIAEEVGSLRVVNNVVDTTYQQNRILNQQANGTF